MFLRTYSRFGRLDKFIRTCVHLDNTKVRVACSNSNLRLFVSPRTFVSTANDKVKLSVDDSVQSLRSPLVIKRLYDGVLAAQIKAIKIFSLSSSVVGLVSQPFLYKEIATQSSIGITLAVYSFFGFFTFVMPVLLHLITKKYVIHLDYNPSKETYIATTVNLFCMSKQTEFTLDEVKVPEVPGMFTTLHAKGKALFVDPAYFKNPEHYIKLMGYDKPMDFKLYSPPASLKKKVNQKT